MSRRRQKRWPSSRASTGFGKLTRSELMARVKSRGNTTTELRMVALLKSNEITGWRRHYATLGRPDFVWLKQRLAVFVDGCFWHGHQCGRNLQPKTNVHLWARKIADNRARDIRTSRRLRDAGWHVLRVWECVLKDKPKVVARRLLRRLSYFGR
jgi:DNA mismatch endonuclease (patch repair protein)